MRSDHRLAVVVHVFAGMSLLSASLCGQEAAQTGHKGAERTYRTPESLRQAAQPFLAALGRRDGRLPDPDTTRLFLVQYLGSEDPDMRATACEVLSGVFKANRRIRSSAFDPYLSAEHASGVRTLALAFSMRYYRGPYGLGEPAEQKERLKALADDMEKLDEFVDGVREAKRRVWASVAEDLSEEPVCPRCFRMLAMWDGEMPKVLRIMEPGARIVLIRWFLSLAVMERAPLLRRRILYVLRGVPSDVLNAEICAWYRVQADPQVRKGLRDSLHGVEGYDRERNALAPIRDLIRQDWYFRPKPRKPKEQVREPREEEQSFGSPEELREAAEPFTMRLARRGRAGLDVPRLVFARYLGSEDPKMRQAACEILAEVFEAGRWIRSSAFDSFLSADHSADVRTIALAYSMRYFMGPLGLGEPAVQRKKLLSLSDGDLRAGSEFVNEVREEKRRLWGGVMDDLAKEPTRPRYLFMLTALRSEVSQSLKYASPDTQAVFVRWLLALAAAQTDREARKRTLCLLGGLPADLLNTEICAWYRAHADPGLARSISEVLEFYLGYYEDKSALDPIRKAVQEDGTNGGAQE